MIIKNEHGTWLVEGGIKSLIKPSKKFKDDKAVEEAKNLTEDKKAELNKLGYELLEELPHLIATFYPTIKAIMKTANIKLTKEQDELIKKYVELKRKVDK